MIVKRVGNPKKSAGKAERIQRLSSYILSPESSNRQEKCIHSGSRGFLSGTPAGHVAEMQELAEVAVRSRDPVNHYVLSWREGEAPTAEQVEEAVDLFLGELGLAGHQAIHGLHADTDNIHLHVMVNRVHPETEKCVEINRGFDLEAAHRAVALIEAAQGWEPEAKALSRAAEDGDPVRKELAEPRPRQPGQRQRDMEHRTGEKSAERLAIEQAGPVIAGAGSWAELHRGLGEIGMRYEKAGSGAKVWVGDVPVKASAVSRNASLGKLQKRLGEYEPAVTPMPVAAPEPEPLVADLPGWDAYAAGRRQYQAGKAAAREEIDRWQALERAQLAEEQRKQRRELTPGSWKGRGFVLNSWRMVIAGGQAAARAALRQRHRQQLAAWRKRFRPWPDIEEWLRIRRGPEAAVEWRYRNGVLRACESARYVRPEAGSVCGFTGVLRGNHAEYFREGGSRPSFVDRGRRIEVLDWQDRDTVRAALELSAGKWGDFIVTGCSEYKAVCAELAAEHGYQIVNPELQEAIRQHRRDLEQKEEEAQSDSSPSGPSPELSLDMAGP